MTIHRLICVLTLLAFLPPAIGCSATKTLPMEDDPVESDAGKRLQAGEPVEITGYERPEDGFRKWKGVVQKVTPDSLQFTPAVEGSGPPSSFRLAMADVVSINALEFSQGNTTVLVVAGVLAVGLIAIAIFGYLFSQSWGD